MQNLLKFTLLTLISLTTLNAINLNSISDQTFSSNRYSGFINPAFNASSVQAKFINSKYLRIGNDIYSLSSPSEIVFNTSIKKDIGFFLNTPFNDLYYHNSNFETIKIPCQFSGDSILACARSYASITNGSVKEVEFSYYQKFNISKVTECQADENFNTETKECQKCPEGYSWNPTTNRCYKDCSDAKKNMYGWDDGSCTDCSHAKTTADVYRCFCGGLGLGVPNEITDPGFPNGGKCGRKGACLDGYQFEYTDPECKEDKDPKPDDNSTKPQDPDTPDNPKDPKDPKPNPDNPNPNPDGPKPDPDDSNNEFCKKNPNDPKCKDDYCKKNPKDPKCKKDTNSTKPSGPGGGGGGDDDGKDKDAKFDPKDFDFKDLEKDVNDFKSKYSDALDTVYNSFTNTKQGIEQFIANVQGKGMNGITKKNVPTTCPRKHVIDFNGYPSELNFDFCKVVSPASGAFYHLFYVIFFLGFLMLIVKLLILSF